MTVQVRHQIDHQLVMDGADLTAPLTSTTVATHHMSRPTLGFPLGTALLLIIIFCVSGIFSYCYHWEKLQSLRHRHDHPDHDTNAAATTLPYQHSMPSSPSKLITNHQESKQGKWKSLPVIMPGDQIPKFMAWPCPKHNQPPLPSLPSAEISIITIEVEVVVVPSFQSHHFTTTTAPSVN